MQSEAGIKQRAKVERALRRKQEALSKRIAKLEALAELPPENCRGQTYCVYSAMFGDFFYEQIVTHTPLADVVRVISKLTELATKKQSKRRAVPLAKAFDYILSMEKEELVRVFGGTTTFPIVVVPNDDTSMRYYIVTWYSDINQRRDVPSYIANRLESAITSMQEEPVPSASI